MTIEIVMSFATIIVTFLLGLLTKKVEIVESKYIPIQNVLIGIIAGLLGYACGLYTNVFVGILTCFWSAMSAGGIYDLVKTRSDD